MKKAFFLDRDGVVIEQISYLHDPEQVAVLPGVPEALAEIHRNGYLAVVISNQSGVARGYFTIDAVHQVNARMKQLISEANGEYFDGIYFCPHSPDDNCQCRKPLPGLFRQAEAELGIDIAGSVMVGDRRSDLTGGQIAGCRSSFMVRTGYGAGEEAKGNAEGFTVCDDLLAVTRHFFNEH